MTQNRPLGNHTVAPLTNVGLCVGLIELAQGRDPRLPGLVGFYGFSGFGKSTAASYAYNRCNAYYIECRDTMSKKSFLQELLKEMGVAEKAMPRTVDEMFLRAVQELQDNPRRPLIIDEMDHLEKKSFCDTVRALHDKSGSVVLLIGEEDLPGKIARWERFDGRMLKWEAAQPVSLTDVGHLARLYCPGIALEEDLLAHLHELAAGSARRVSTNLCALHEEARRRGVDRLRRSDIGGLTLSTGKAPKPRSRS